MAYLNEDGLARYDGLIKQWVTLKSGTVDGVDALLNWQKTETAGAVACYPLPAAPIDPVVNFAFTETGPAEGTKGPDNPSTISGASSIKVGRCGKNLLIYPYIETSYTYTSGITATTDAAGLVTVNGTSPSTTAYFSVSDGGSRVNENPSSMALTVGETYTASLSLVGGTAARTSDIMLVIVDHEAGAVSATVAIGSSVSFTAASSSFRARLEIKKNTSFSNVTVAPQLELGSAATSFEPYEGSDYTVNLGGTYYGGSVDLSTGVMTVTWAGKVFNGTESFSEYGTDGTDSRFVYILTANSLPVPQGGSSNAKCSHANFVDNNTAVWGDFRVSKSGTTIGYFIMQDKNNVVGTKDDFTTWVAGQYSAGTPLTVAYKIATPYTVQLTPTQIYSLSQPDPYVPRINTVYSDQVSAQVGYPKSPQATSTELTNAIVSLGGNI